MCKIKVCSCPLKYIKYYRYCGAEVVENEICFVPGVTKEQIEKGDISFVEPDAKNFKVELVCCNYILVSGLITKKIKYPKYLIADVDEDELVKEEETAVKNRDILWKKYHYIDIPVQIKIPVNINNAKYLDIDKWEVVGVEICSNSCVNLICPKDKSDYNLKVEEDVMGDENYKPPTFPHLSYHKLIEKDIVTVLIESKDKYPW